MKKLKVLVVDDEQGAREDMLSALEELDSKVIVGGLAKSVSEAELEIERFKPDLVFLDIEMPRESGFDLLRKFETIDFDIVFTTAFDSYAIQAIKFSALDYILKPVSVKDLETAIDKSIHQGRRAQMEYYKNLLSNLEENNDDPTIALREKERTTVVRASEIIRFESDRNYTQVFLNSGERILLSKTLKVFDSMLQGCGFLRIHKSHLINVDHIDQVIIKDLKVKMKTGELVSFSLRKKKELNDYLRSLTES